MSEAIELQVGEHKVRLSNPDKVFFPEAGLNKLDLANYYLAVAEGALTGVRNRPMALKRYPNGAAEDFFFQKRAPTPRPDYVQTVTLSFPSGRTAEEVVVSNAAALLWTVNLGCLDLNPHAIRADDLEHPDELRVDLDPEPNIPFSQVRQVASVVNEVLTGLGLKGFPKTSGSRGIHVNVRIEKKWGFSDVRRAALALAREVERKAPSIATSKWWKEERHGVFLDYNQNAKDRTVASVYSIRPRPDACVSAPFLWSELDAIELQDFTVKTMPARYAAQGDLGKGIDDVSYSLDSLLELSARHESEGQGDAPWPPHYAKQDGEPKRVAPSRAKKAPK